MTFPWAVKARSALNYERNADLMINLKGCECDSLWVDFVCTVRYEPVSVITNCSGPGVLCVVQMSLIRTVTMISILMLIRTMSLVEALVLIECFVL